ncbi:MAG: CbiX/SirB N-terminal domain-containing protein, partial [Clostridiales bacterium]
EEGIFDIIVLPLFLYTGMHIKKDIPSMLEGYQKDEPRLKFTMARPMEDDDLIVDIMVKRYEELNNQ